MVEPDSKDANNQTPGHEKLSKRGYLAFFVVQLLILIICFFILMEGGLYGWTLFCSIPLCIGLTIGTYSRTYHSKKLLKAGAMGSLVILVLSVLLLALKFEGAICILMALGILALPAGVGIFLGFLIRNTFKLMSVLVIGLLCSSSMVYDTRSDEQVQSIASETISVHASKEKIWRVLTQPVVFTAQDHLLFKAGISYPTSMFLKKENDCLFLNCGYTNGRTKLRIENLDSLRRLRFVMPEEITTMKELSFYDKISAPHLQGYFKPAYGEFIIVEKKAGYCDLIAKTAYSYKITPKFYWNWWTDYLANTMHRKGLEDLKKLAER